MFQLIETNEIKLIYHEDFFIYSPYNQGVNNSGAECVMQNQIKCICLFPVATHLINM